MSRTIEANGHRISILIFRDVLISWGREHFRHLPWRLAAKPYRILIAETMLHRTQALQVARVYKHFIRQYPDLPAVSRAGKKELGHTLYPLGLRWRISMIQKMCLELIERFGGRIPRQKSELLSLPGVSDYIASAVRCFVWNCPEPLIDTNTVRVVGRLFGLSIKDSSRRNRQFKELISALVDPENPRAYNYALLDLADQVCTKKRPPDCVRCPVKRYCVYGASVLVSRSRPKQKANK
jgi:A/G-specific adenine glycosylase